MSVMSIGQSFSSSRTHRPLSSQARPEATASPMTRCPTALALTTCKQRLLSFPTRMNESESCSAALQ